MTRLTVAERLVKNSKRNAAGCLLWKLSKNDKGYGRISVNGKMRYCHRVSMSIKLGRELGPNEVVMHNCDTPGCWNPNHLELGTLVENVRQMDERGRRGRRLTNLQVIQIKLALRYRRPRSVAKSLGLSEYSVSQIYKGLRYVEVKLPKRVKPEYDAFA